MKDAYRVDLTKSFDENATRAALFPFASIAHVVQTAPHVRAQAELKHGSKFDEKIFRSSYRSALGEAASIEGLKLGGYMALIGITYNVVQYFS